MYYVYVLSSESDAKTYVGISSDISRRLKQHNRGYHPYTRRYLPWKLLFYENFQSRVDARIREKYLKSASGRRWLRKNYFKN